MTLRLRRRFACGGRSEDGDWHKYPFKIKQEGDSHKHKDKMSDDEGRRTKIVLTPGPRQVFLASNDS